MFGSLFENEDADLQAGIAASVEGSASSASQKFGAPPFPRQQSKLAGIANQGATCYLNSLLQTLLLTPEFRESLFQLSAGELGCLEDRDKPAAKVRVIPLQLQKLFTRLLLLDQKSVSTEELTESFGWTNNEQLQQHDVQELNRILFSAIEDSLAGTSGHSLIQQLYHGNIVNQIICQECEKISEREEDFLDLTLSVSGVSSLETGLQYSYCDMELMDGKNQYRCDRCQKLVNAKKGAKIRSLPSILTVSLLRFSFDFQTMQRYKETGKFTFPNELDMSPYVEEMLPETIYKYELFSVVIHRGGAHGGHYHAYIRDIDDLGHWVAPSVSEIQLPRKVKGAEEMIKTNSPQELIEIILEKQPKQTLPIDKLGNEINKETGVTWNKRFKRHHGTLAKFLTNCEGRIVYDPYGRIVSLVDSLEAQIKQIDLNTSLAEKEGETMETVEKNESNSSIIDIDDLDRRKLKSSLSQDPPPSGYRWFNFDDSNVTPMHQSEIEKHYQGRESAYMLFYRRKQADRPNEAFNNPAYCVPDQLLNDVLAENDALEKKRQEYDELVNTVLLQLHFEPHYHYNKGALKLKQEGRQFTEVKIDRRKTIADLMEIVREVGGCLVPEKLTVHRMRDLAAGPHLYDCISDEPEQKLMSLNIDSNSKLFVWDGSQVDGGSIPIGVDCEPVYLTIVYGNPSQFSCGFPKNISLRDLRVSISDLTGIEVPALSLKRLVGSETDPEFKTLEGNLSLTLAEMTFRDGDQIIAGTKNSEEMKTIEASVTPGGQFFVLVENRCIESGSAWTKQIEVSKDMSIGELKIMAVSAFEENSILDGGRLRFDHPSLGLRPPLHEQQTVGEVGLSSSSCLILEPGKAPESNQVTLTFTPGDPKSERPDLEVTVEKTCLVKTCLQTMLLVAGFSGDEWHLQKTNWCGEPAEVLDDLDLSLDKSLVNDGDHLLLLVGSLPPKGYLRLAIFLYPSPDNPQYTSPAQPGMLSWITSGIQGLLSSSSSPDAICEPLQVGEIEISKDATLEDLKLQVMTLSSIQEMPIPTAGFMRLRLIDNHQLGKILTDTAQTLRRLKVTVASRIAIQILPLEEHLGPNEIVIGVKQRLPGTLEYTPEQELIFDVSRGATPYDFRQCIADFVALPVEQIVIAKHFPRQFKWTIVEGKKAAANNNQKGKKKKGGGVKASMKQAPYHLQDGDVIGVKTVQGDPDNKDDFRTDEDVRGRKQVEHAAEEKRKMREERKKAYGESKSSRPEVALTIKVDRFT